MLYTLSAGLHRHVTLSCHVQRAPHGAPAIKERCEVVLRREQLNSIRSDQHVYTRAKELIDPDNPIAPAERCSPPSG